MGHVFARCETCSFGRHLAGESLHHLRHAMEPHSHLPKEADTVCPHPDHADSVYDNIAAHGSGKHLYMTNMSRYFTTHHLRLFICSNMFWLFMDIRVFSQSFNIMKYFTTFITGEFTPTISWMSLPFLLNPVRQCLQWKGRSSPPPLCLTPYIIESKNNNT